MPKRSRIKKVVVKVSHEERGKAEKDGESDIKEGKVVERFIIPMLKPFQLQPLPIETNLPKLPRLPPAPQVKDLRQILSDEKARILAMVKVKKPESLYKLAKLLGRDFKAVRDDVKLLEKFGFIKLIHEKDKKTKKKRLRPLLAIEKLQITVEF